jgi:hypothetical protein
MCVTRACWVNAINGAPCPGLVNKNREQLRPIMLARTMLQRPGCSDACGSSARLLTAETAWPTALTYVVPGCRARRTCLIRERQACLGVIAIAAMPQPEYPPKVAEP